MSKVGNHIADSRCHNPQDHDMTFYRLGNLRLSVGLSCYIFMELKHLQVFSVTHKS
jgi:hypothetical protein